MAAFQRRDSGGAAKLYELDEDGGTGAQQDGGGTSGGSGCNAGGMAPPVFAALGWLLLHLPLRRRRR
ncbi:MAG: hypothetical protein IAG13_22385 [Deltaproteobacteria bacterium]|nr:hypothetical protein [Nannocystaceae bacterium]